MSSSIDLRAVLAKSLESLSAQLNEAVVYLDDEAAACLSASVGLSTLLRLGAVNIHSLADPSEKDAALGSLLVASMVPGKTNRTPNVVVFLTGLLHEAIQDLLSVIKVHPMCCQLHVFCCYSADAHSQIENRAYEQNAYADFESKLKSELALDQGHSDDASSLSAERPVLAEKLEINIRYCPWLYSCLSSQAFILQQRAPRSSSLGWTTQTTHATPLYKDTGRLREIYDLSQAIVGFASHLGYKLDVFTLGTDAHAIGTEVVKTGVPTGLNDAPLENTAALILVDRCFDLVSPLHHADTLLDRIIAAVESEGSSNFKHTSRLTDLSVMLSIGTDGSTQKTHLFAAEPSDLPLFVNHLIGRTCRDGSLYVRKWIREEIRAAGLRSEYKPKAGAPNKEEFSTGVDILQSSVNSSKRQAVRTLGAFTAKAIDSDMVGTRAELILSNERQILNMPSTEDIVQYFLDLLLNVSKTTALLQFEDVCCLLAFAYTILNDDADEPFNPTEERLILEALVQCALSDHNQRVLDLMLPSRLTTDMSALKLEVRSALQERLEAMKKLSSTRKALKDLRRLTPPLTPEHSPLVRHLVSMILQNKNISDLRHETSTLQGILQSAGGKGLLSKGLGRLGLGMQQESAVGGHDVAIVFVIGGISVHEINSIAQEIEESGRSPWKTKIISGSNTLLTPHQTVKKTWNFEQGLQHPG